MKILTIHRGQLNKISDNFGDMIIEWLPVYKGPYIMLHQQSTADLFNSPMPHQFKQLLEVLIHYLNRNGYQCCQVLK